MKSVWKDEEVKSLFESVEQVKKGRHALKLAFLEHAQRYGRQGNSVRNYYYSEVENLKNDENRCKRLGIDLSKHTKNKLIPFSKEQESEFLKNVEKLTSEGYSVRSACFELGHGDMTLVTRLQNKYQNLKKPNNIVNINEHRRVLTDADINSLFMGLFKLVKKNAAEEALIKVKNDKMNRELELKKMCSELVSKDKEIRKLKEEVEKLKRERQDLLLKMDKTGLLRRKFEGTGRLTSLQIN